MTFKSPYDSKIIEVENEIRDLRQKLVDLEVRKSLYSSWINPSQSPLREIFNDWMKVQKQLDDAWNSLFSLQESKKKYVQEKLEELKGCTHDWRHDSYHLT